MPAAPVEPVVPQPAPVAPVETIRAPAAEPIIFSVAPVETPDAPLATASRVVEAPLANVVPPAPAPAPAPLNLEAELKDSGLVLVQTAAHIAAPVAPAEPPAGSRGRPRRSKPAVAREEEALVMVETRQ